MFGEKAWKKSMVDKFYPKDHRKKTANIFTEQTSLTLFQKVQHSQRQGVDYESRSRNLREKQRDPKRVLTVESSRRDEHSFEN